MLGPMAAYVITGVSGALGSRVITQFGSKLHGELIGVDRRPLRNSAPGLRYKNLDLAVSDLRAGFEGADVVVHLATSGGVSVLRRVLDAAVVAKVSSIITLSSAAALGAWATNSVPLTEGALVRPNPGFPYAVDYAEQERMLADFKDSNPSISVCILRLALIPGGGMDRAIAAALGGMEAYRWMEAGRPVQFLHIDDAVNAVMHAIERRLDGVFNVAPDGFVNEERAREITGALPRPSLPRRLAFVINNLLWRMRHGSSFVAAHPYLEHPWVLSNDKLKAVGWQPLYSSEEALVASVPSGPLVKFGTRQRRQAVVASIFGSGALTISGFSAAVVLLARWVRQRSRA